MSTKVMSLRLSEELAAELAAVARTDGIPVSGAVREAGLSCKTFGSYGVFLG